MKKTLILGILLLSACGKEADKAVTQTVDTKPVITQNGSLIRFPDAKTSAFFETETVSNANVQAELKAPARVVATVVRSVENPNQNLVLFDNPDLTSNYTMMLQHLININRIENVNIRQRVIELDRAKDLLANGAASGKEVLEAQTALAMEQTNLANEKAAIIEHEARLKLAGFNPEALIHARASSVWVICDIPENQLTKIGEGKTCEMVFTSFPEKKFTGQIEKVGDVVDNITRMVKLRIGINNPDSQLKAGMFATVSFGVSEGNFITVPKEALVIVQSKNFVFVRTEKQTFQRKEVQTGQQIGERVLITSGLANNDQVVVTGTMQLKGISFGY